MDVLDRFYLKTYCHISKAVAFDGQRTSCLISFPLVLLWKQNLSFFQRPLKSRSSQGTICAGMSDSYRINPHFTRTVVFLRTSFLLVLPWHSGSLVWKLFPTWKKMSFMMDLTSNFTTASIWWPWRLAAKPICLLNLSLQKKSNLIGRLIKVTYE